MLSIKEPDISFAEEQVGRTSDFALLEAQLESQEEKVLAAEGLESHPWVAVKPGLWRLHTQPQKSPKPRVWRW